MPIKMCLQPPLDLLNFLSVQQTLWCLAYRTTFVSQCMLASNELGTRGLLVFGKYKCHPDILVVGLQLTQFQRAFP